MKFPGTGTVGGMEREQGKVASPGATGVPGDL